MIQNIPIFISLFSWFIFFMYWLALMDTVKPTLKRQPTGKRRWYWLLMMSSYVFLFLNSDFLGLSWQGDVFYGFPIVKFFGAIISLFGLVVAMWARFTLSTNWSASVTLKEKHELVTYGPYAYTRHPIYTGMLLMFIGTGFVFGTLLQLLAIILLVLSINIKMKQEEALMLQTFGEKYENYSKKTKRLIPFLY